MGLGEVQAGFNVFLGNGTIQDCPPADSDGDGEVSLGEVQAGFNAFLSGCGPTLRGTCLAPGGPDARPRPPGLARCRSGMMVRAFRCPDADRSRCLKDPRVLTLLTETRIDEGNFKLALADDAFRDAAVVVEAEIDGEERYRVLAFGRLARGGGSQVTADLELSPVSEAAARLIDENAFEQFSDAGADAIAGAVALAIANDGVDFAESTVAGAVDLATATARASDDVATAIESNRIPQIAGIWEVVLTRGPGCERPGSTFQYTFVVSQNATAVGSQEVRQPTGCTANCGGDPVPCTAEFVLRLLGSIESQTRAELALLLEAAGQYQCRASTCQLLLEAGLALNGTLSSDSIRGEYTLADDSCHASTNCAGENSGCEDLCNAGTFDITITR